MLHSITELMWQNEKSMLSLHLLSNSFPNGNSETKLYLCEAAVCSSSCALHSFSGGFTSEGLRRLHGVPSSKKKGKNGEHFHMQHVFAIRARSEYQIRNSQWEVMCLKPCAIKHIHMDPQAGAQSEVRADWLSEKLKYVCF